MASGQKFTVRPFSKSGRSDLNDAFKIYLSPTALLSLKLRSGDPCSILLEGSTARTAISWTAVEKIQDTVVQTSKLVQDLYGFRLGDKVSIVKANRLVPEVEVVTLEEAPKDHVDLLKGQSTSRTDKTHWEWFMEHPLSKAQYICAGMQLGQVELKGQRKSFVVRELSSDTGSPMQDLFKFSERSRVRIREELPSDLVVSSIFFNLESMLHGVGGLRRQIEQINGLLHDFDATAPTMAMPPYYHGNSGIMFYGPKGTGKTLVLKKITTGPWRKVFNITGSIMSGNEGSGEKRVREIFATARHFEPSLISIDQLEFLAPKRKFSESFSSPTLAPILCEVLASLNGSQVLIIAATRHPNDVDETLRTPNRFGVEVELPVPNATDRKDILQAIRGSSDQPSDTLIDFAAEKTHGFVGADLFALLQVACRKGRARCMGIGLEHLTNGHNLSQSEQIQPMQLLPFELMEQDIVKALVEIRPTAMREVVLETPRTRWSDIGGQHEIKLRLQKAVERPLKMAERMRKLNISSRKGILLYGPPGCSKTLLVKALATEAGLNFLAVKGAEMLSMYVGESERALREIFRKARAASPSIIFFDEIDAIASKRTEDGRNDGVNILTTLLNEMDGIEELKNVLVVAATNKPEVLDPALMRPGRLDNLFYVGPPDLQAREEIFSLWTRKSTVTSTVDIGSLAGQTEGYSGAEIISICETAGEVALDEEELSGVEQQIDVQHFQLALTKVKKQITPEVVQRYERFGVSLPQVT